MPMRPSTHKPVQRVTERHGDAQQAALKRLYGYAWQKASKAFLAENPLCTTCSEAGKLVAAAEVDHIKPHRGNRTMFWDKSNWQPLCKPCHSRKTATEDGGFGHTRGRGV